MASPVVPVPGMGQVGEGLQNSWGLEEVDDDMEENDNSAEEQEEEMAEVYKETGNRAGCSVCSNVSDASRSVVIIIFEATF